MKNEIIRSASLRGIKQNNVHVIRSPASWLQCLLQGFTRNFPSRQNTLNGLKYWGIALALMFSWISQGEAVTLINGGGISAAISIPGEHDSYTFTASAGQSIQIRAANTSGGAFVPRIDLYTPSGALLTYGVGATVATIGSNTLGAGGTYTVVVSDASAGNNQTGNYNLYFVMAPGANTNGTLVNGGMKSNALVLGGMDSYTFTASAGQSIQIRAANTSGGAFVPRVDLYTPSGALLTYGVGATVATIGSNTLGAGGTYTVVVSDASAGNNQTGNYNLYFVMAPGANTNGTLVNGGMKSNALVLGGMDSYTFTASAGQSIQIRAANTSGGAFVPRIDLYTPSGALLTYGVGATVATIGSNTLGAGGTYTVVVSDASAGNNQTGNYNLYFILAPGANEGGTLGSGVLRSSTLDLGDLDSYTFSASTGANIQMAVTKTSSGAFVPRVDLYTPSGALLTYGVGATVATIGSNTLGAGGTYTVVVSDASAGNSQTGAYTILLTGTGITSVDNPGAGTGSGSGSGTGSAGSSSNVAPIPEWALVMLGVGLVTISLKMRGKAGLKD